MINFNKQHKSVFLHDAVNALKIRGSGIYVDGTFGLGGHAKLILSKLNQEGRLFAFDRDLFSVNLGKSLFFKDIRFTIAHRSFSEIIQYIEDLNLIGKIDGILLDLGISNFQLNDVSRGFSFIHKGFLDMRMDTTSGKSASEWLSKASLDDIFWVLKNFGEERFSKKIASAIVRYRKKNPIVCSKVLASLIFNCYPYFFCKKNPATKSFLAIRIHVNKELEELKKILEDSLKILSLGGRLVVISFHSLEDRLVKNFVYQHSYPSNLFRKFPLTEAQILNKCYNNYILKIVEKKRPSVQEVKNNIRSRSAVLRSIEKLTI